MTALGLGRPGVLPIEHGMYDAARATCMSIIRLPMLIAMQTRTRSHQA